VFKEVKHAEDMDHLRDGATCFYVPARMTGV